MADILLDDRVVSPHHGAQQEISTHIAVYHPAIHKGPLASTLPEGRIVSATG